MRHPSTQRGHLLRPVPPFAYMPNHFPDPLVTAVLTTLSVTLLTLLILAARMT